MAWYRCVGGAGGSLKLRTTSGRIASFSTNMAETFKSLKSEINPYQDLHGYSKPWSGGGGKNKCNYNVWKTSSITNGTAVWENNGVKLTATANDCYTQAPTGFPSGAIIPISEGETITLSWEETTNKDGSIYIFPNNTTTGMVRAYNQQVKKLSYTATSGVTYVTFRFGVSNSGDTIAYKNIQIEKGNQATAYEPYSNICPISGFSTLNVTRTGKNLLNGDTFASNFAGCSDYSKDTTNKTVKFTHSAGITEDLLCYVLKMPFKANTQYTLILSYEAVARNTSLRIFYTDGTTSYCDLVATTEKTPFRIVSTANKTIKYIAVGYWGAGLATLYYNECGLFEGVVTLADFEPYKGSKYQSFFKGLMDGTYGYVELGSLNWQKNGTNRFTSINQPDNIKAPSSQSEYAKIACPKYQTSNFTTVYSESTDKIVAINTNKAINIVDKAYDDATAFKNALSGVYLIYELATATTPTITQAEINTLISAFGADLNAIKFGTTVYGGEVDLTNERVNVSRKIVDLSTLSWVYATSAKRWEALKADMKNYPSRSADIIFEKYETDITATAGSEGKGFISALVIYVTSNDSTTPPSGNACYPLATPTEISFEAEPIKPLVGVNNIYGDTNGDTEVKYLYRE